MGFGDEHVPENTSHEKCLQCRLQHNLYAALPNELAGPRLCNMVPVFLTLDAGLIIITKLVSI